jgi:hypothetical protein
VWDSVTDANGGMVTNVNGEFRVHGYNVLDGDAGEVIIGISSMGLDGRQIAGASLSMRVDMAEAAAELLRIACEVARGWRTGGRSH